MEKIFGMLGLARRAGKLIYGSDAAVNAVRSGKAKAVILAADASDRTKKLMRNKCASFGTPLFEVEAGCEELGKKLGKSGISVLGISDINFAKAIINLINK